MFHTRRCSLASTWMCSFISHTETTFLLQAGYKLWVTHCSHSCCSVTLVPLHHLSISNKNIPTWHLPEVLCVLLFGGQVTTCYTTLLLPRIIQGGINQSVISRLQSGLRPATQTLPTQTRTVSPNHTEKKINSPASSHQLSRHALEMLGLIHCSIQMKGIPGQPSADRLRERDWFLNQKQ